MYVCSLCTYSIPCSPQLLVHGVGPTTVGTMVLVVVTMCVSVEILSMGQIVPTKDVSCVVKIAEIFSGRKFSNFAVLHSRFAG